MSVFQVHPFPVFHSASPQNLVFDVASDSSVSRPTSHGWGLSAFTPRIADRWSVGESFVTSHPLVVSFGLRCPVLPVLDRRFQVAACNTSPVFFQAFFAEAYRSNNIIEALSLENVSEHTILEAINFQSINSKEERRVQDAAAVLIRQRFPERLIPSILKAVVKRLVEALPEALVILATKYPSQILAQLDIIHGFGTPHFLKEIESPDLSIFAKIDRVLRALEPLLETESRALIAYEILISRIQDPVARLLTLSRLPASQDPRLKAMVSRIERSIRSDGPI